MDIAELLGGRDMTDVKKAVGFILENSDDFEKILKLARDLPDDALGFLGQLPKLMQTIGDGLAQAGEQAGKAANALVGDDGEGGAKRALAGSADTMVAAKDKLNDAAGMLSGLAGEFNQITIPTVEPKFTEVVGLKVVSGVDVGSSKVLGGPAKRLTDGAGTISGVATELDSLAGDLRDLSGILASVGEALSGLGGKLSESGGSVKTLVGG